MNRMILWNFIKFLGLFYLSFFLYNNNRVIIFLITLNYILIYYLIILIIIKIGKYTKMPTTKLLNWQKILNLNKFKKNWQKKCQNFPIFKNWNCQLSISIILYKNFKLTIFHSSLTKK